MIQDATVIATPIIRPGTLLLGTYEVERQLNSGGMAKTYLTHHLELNRTKHVVKVIKPELIGSLADALNLNEKQAEQTTVDLFKREAEALMKIRHEAIVGYHGFQKDNRFGYCLVMEYVEGPSLKEYLRDEKLTIKQFWQLRDQLAAGLAAAHAKGVFHRDISPDNIILANAKIDNAKLIDFGIAKVYEPNNQGTIIGSLFVGKYDYAAPEQFAGEEIGAYSDIYSLGLVLAEGVLGKKLSISRSETVARQNRTKVPDLMDLPAELRTQFTAMLQPEPHQRPQSMTELVKRWPAPDLTEDFPNKTLWIVKNRRLLLGSLGMLIVAGVASLMPFEQLKENFHSSLNTHDRQYGYFSLTTTPPGAVVLANDNKSFIGVTPINRNLIPSQINHLTILKSGFREENLDLEIAANENKSADIALQKTAEKSN